VNIWLERKLSFTATVISYYYHQSNDLSDSLIKAHQIAV